MSNLDYVALTMWWHEIEANRYPEGSKEYEYHNGEANRIRRSLIAMNLK